MSKVRTWLPQQSHAGGGWANEPWLSMHDLPIPGWCRPYNRVYVLQWLGAGDCIDRKALQEDLLRLCQPHKSSFERGAVGFSRMLQMPHCSKILEFFSALGRTPLAARACIALSAAPAYTTMR